MRSGKYYEYLQSLDKKQLIELLCDFKKPSKPYPYKSYRTVALRMSYDGRNYRGVQSHCFIKSIGDELDVSLAITGIGENPVFCGRTDAGVSAINMIVSLRVKSRLEAPNRTYELTESDHEEYPYDKIINERLPEDIRITGWAPVPDGFSARHWCVQRHYKYYFVLKGMDIGRIRAAADQVLALDDFYKLSTHSNPKAVYKRRIDELTIVKEEQSPAMHGRLQINDRSDEAGSRCKENSTNNNKNIKKKYGKGESTHTEEKAAGDAGPLSHHEDLYRIDIKAPSFLHNMVRKIVWVMKNCGEGNEFDLGNVRIAEAYPLVFAGARFEEKLNFLGNRFSQTRFEKQEDEARIYHRISRLRLDSFNK